MSIEALKEQARRHEQNEEWQKALDQYQKAIRALAKDDQTDIGLYNRVGDLFVRVGKLDAAVEHYEQAVDLYREAYLPNNAIAVCKKVIRNVPKRHQAYLKIGQIRAEQGFLPDARTNFLTYAERMQKEGDLDESFRALIEFCDLAPDEVDVRIQVADQMATSGKVPEAVQQLLVAYGRLKGAGESDVADAVERKIFALDPDADLSAAPVASPAASDGDFLTPFGEIQFSSDETDDQIAAHAVTEDDGRTPAEREFARVFGEGDDAAGTGSDEGEEGAELPMMSFDAEESSGDEADEGPELPIMAFDEDEDASEDATPLPTLGDDEDAPPDALDAAAFGASTRDEREPMVSGPVDVDEIEIGLADIGPGDAPEGPAPASGGPARHAEEAVEESRRPAERPAAAPPSTPPAAPPPSQQPEYVDLGAMVLGGKGEKTTRFKVAYEEPTGDEQADFAKMLSQFKEKVSENLDSSDVRAHHDLGTAYKEMGLLDEAIGSFQQALRASASHLPTYELMGQTFIEMGKPEAAVKSLHRALEIGAAVEDELIGIYYYLARAYETLGQKEPAIEFYDRVFSLDINFADVTERLRALR